MKSIEAAFGPNAALVEELYDQYQADPSSVPDHWKTYFDEIDQNDSARELSNEAEQTNGTAPPPKKKSSRKNKSAAPQPSKESKLEPIKGPAEKIAENMETSLQVPTATSVRDMPVKMLVDNRATINSHLKHSGGRKTSFTHIIAWAIIKALDEFPNMNNAFARSDGGPQKTIPEHINMGLAIDVQHDDGSRNLLVPNIKGVEKMEFSKFLDAYANLINKARSGGLGLDDFADTTLTLTNPGMIGTVSSVPRLMQSQGTIIATGAIGFPAAFQSASAETLNRLGISKVMTITSTYDHRVIQGAESGSFLKYIDELLNGAHNFYEEIFKNLGIPYPPVSLPDEEFKADEPHGLAENKRAIAVINLIDAYRRRGHTLAHLDPLSNEPNPNPDLRPEHFGLSAWDLDREFYCAGLGGQETAKLRTILQLLRDTYCGYLGAEYMHILDDEKRHWLQERMEGSQNNPEISKDDTKEILHKLNQAMAFEQFLGKKYIGHKRFSLEGADTLIPMMHFLLNRAGDDRVGQIFMGMAHRGRLNILVNIMNKPYEQVFADFEGNLDPDSIQGSGDVKYHLGARGKHKTDDGKTIGIELMPNPSHLESVNPVVEGAARATEDEMAASEADKAVLPILIHGDAAFAGQGVVTETLNMAGLDAYETGGTIHFIINNQIGFTTLPKDGRTTAYVSDFAKMIQAPIFHVNGDKPEEAVHAIKMAFDYRQQFGHDIVIDLVCFRKHGHNEGDEPAFTQPGMYKEIDHHKTVRDIYARELVKQGQLSEDEAREIFDEFEELLRKAFDEAKNNSPLEVTDDMINRPEKSQHEWDSFPDTTCPEEELNDIAVKLNTVPKDFDANPKLLKQLAKRAEIVESNAQKIDWGFAEALAFGSLLKDGTTVRLAGQDAERGTFSHRHAKLHGTKTDQEFTPLNNLSKDQAPFYPYNSLLSEYAALAFEFGYSATKPDALVIWEAQFGDFANGAQIPTDQYISAAEAKWGQKSNLVLTLPHGYEGQGPEHSSARLERYLQLCAEDNMQVVNLTTPAQYFHILRKQAMQEDKKPLIIMSPKSLLRHKLATSKTEDLVSGAYSPLITDNEIDSEAADRLILCSGKVYYDLFQYRAGHEIDDVAIARLEQFYPFPDADVAQLLKNFATVKDIVWCQEEPKNMGGWTFVQPRLSEQLQDQQKLRYVGRQASASPAAGQKKIHKAEQKMLIEEAMDHAE